MELEKLAYSIRSLVAASDIGRNEVLRDIHSGKLRAFRVGRKWVIPAKAAREWLELRLGEMEKAA